MNHFGETHEHGAEDPHPEAKHPDLIRDFEFAIGPPQPMLIIKATKGIWWSDSLTWLIACQ